MSIKVNTDMEENNKWIKGEKTCSSNGCVTSKDVIVILVRRNAYRNIERPEILEFEEKLAVAKLNRTKQQDETEL